MKHYVVIFLALIALVSCQQPKQQSLIILHTNDTHSQVEPKADGTCGYARRMGVIAAERQKAGKTPVILLDAGDFCQGTPYFNFYKGRIEVEALNKMHYDAATLGNHEFDNGIDTLAAVLRLAQFPIVCANYDVTDTPLEDLVKPYIIINRGGQKIGVIGLGVNPEGLIAMHNFLPLKYMEPLPIVNELAERLKKDEQCDVVVCLSHLGTQDPAIGEVCDEWIARNSHDIDVIVGGHTHKMYVNFYVNNLDGKPVLLSQMGKSGGALGKITVECATEE